MKTRNQAIDRQLGHYWEQCFTEMLLRIGLATDKLSIYDADFECWGASGIPFKAQIRHKEPFWWSDIKLCYGYERYRLEKDLKDVEAGYICIYVIHDHSHFGRDSKINRPEDWYAQFIDDLVNTIDKECLGRTYYGDSYERLPICYWQLPKFQPLSEILSIVTKKLEGISQLSF